MKLATRYSKGFLSNYSGYQRPCSWIWEYSIIKYEDRNNTVTKNHLQPPRAMILPQTILKIRSDSSKSFIQFNISCVSLNSFVCNLYVIRMSLLCTRMSFVCHSYMFVNYLCVLVCYSYITRMSFVCHSYVVLPSTNKLSVEKIFL